MFKKGNVNLIQYVSENRGRKDTPHLFYEAKIILTKTLKEIKIANEYPPFQRSLIDTSELDLAVHFTLSISSSLYLYFRT